MSKFGNKNALFGYFCGRILKILLSCIWNQDPQICLIAKFCEKTKNPKSGTKNVLFGYFWTRILKNYCHIWNQHLQICRKWVFNSYSRFWCRVHFFKMSRARFSWRSGSRSGSGYAAVYCCSPYWELVLLVQLEIAQWFCIMTPLTVWDMCTLDVWNVCLQTYTNNRIR